MVSPRSKIDEERQFRLNAKHYKVNNDIEPYFTLTPAGAKALQAYLADKKIKFTPVNSGDMKSNEIWDGTPTEALADFLTEKMKIGIPKESLDCKAISKLLGVASMGIYQDHKSSMVVLDPVALNALAQPKGRAR